jgi:transposase
MTPRSCIEWSRHWKDSKSVFGVGPATRIYVALGATDLRNGFDGRYGIVRDRLGLEVRSGHLFLFANSRRNRLKILYWDGSGLWICSKRLERGKYSWPQQEDQSDQVTLSHEELSLLLGGIDLTRTRSKNWYRQTVIGERKSVRRSYQKNRIVLSYSS